MKTQIDALVRDILYHLAQPSSAVLEVAVFLETIGADGYSKALELRAILARWAEAADLTAEDRMYASQRLRALPAF